MNTSKKCFTKESDFVTRCIKGETIIVPVRGDVGDLDSIYTLNEVGTFVWKLIDGKTSLNQIVDAVCNKYDTTPKQAEKDVTELVSSLEVAGLIHSSVNKKSK